MQLFAISTETLLELIRTNHNIQGYKLPNGKEKKTVAYADDITLIMNNPQSIHHFFNTFDQYSKASAATLNKEKQRPLNLET